MKKVTIVFAFLLISAMTGFAQSGRTESFAYTKSGRGEAAILFIPGFTCSAEVWDETKSHFENNFTCYTLTMAGFAGIAPEAEPSIEKWKNEIAKFIQEQKLNKPVIVGHSMGGGLAMAVAADYPQLVGKVVVVDALPCLAALMNPLFAAKDDLDCSPVIEQMTALPEDQFYEMQKMTANHLLLDSAKRELMVTWSMASDRTTAAQMYCDFSNTDLREKIKNIEAETLVLLEADFKELKLAVNEQFKQMKTARLEYSNVGSHFIMYDDKEWFLNQLLDFIAGS